MNGTWAGALPPEQFITEPDYSARLGDLRRFCADSVPILRRFCADSELMAPASRFIQMPPAMPPMLRCVSAGLESDLQFEPMSAGGADPACLVVTPAA